MGLEDPMEEGMGTYSSILAWRTPWTEETGRLQSTGSQRVGCDLTTEQRFPTTAFESNVNSMRKGLKINGN